MICVHFFGPNRAATKSKVNVALEEALQIKVISNCDNYVQSRQIRADYRLQRLAFMVDIES